MKEFYKRETTKIYTNSIIMHGFMNIFHSLMHWTVTAVSCNTVTTCPWAPALL